MIPLEQSVEAAAKLAYEAHATQKRRDGSPYFGHCERVAWNADKLIEKYFKKEKPSYKSYCKQIIVSAAYLHDVKEDTNYSIDDFCPEITSVVDLVTKRRGDNYFDFIMRIANGYDKDAWIVKLADLQDNLADLEEGSMKDKYRFAEYLLKEKLYGRLV